MTVLWKRLATVIVLLTVGLACTVANAQVAKLAGPTRGNTIHIAYNPTVRAAGMGGATLALEGTDSLNPAALGWLEEGEVELSFGNYDFRSGPSVNYYRADMTYPVLGGGAQVKAYFFDSNHRLSRMPDPAVPSKTSVWGYEFGVAYGRHVNDYVSFGLGAFPLEESTLRLSGVGKGRGESLIGSARLGALARVHEKISVATMFDHIRDRLKDHYESGGCAREMYYANIWTIGGAMHLDEKTVFAADYRWGKVNGNKADPTTQLRVRTTHFGLERQLNDNIALRIGQTRGHITAGAGLKLFDKWELNYAYVDGAAREIDSAFGTATTHLVSLSLKI